MKCLVLDYVKAINQQQLDRSQLHLSNDIRIYDITHQKNYTSFESYYLDHAEMFAEAVFEIQRCDDMLGDVIVLVHVKKDEKVVYDYIGYFTCDEQSIRRIEEYWCRREQR